MTYSRAITLIVVIVGTLCILTIGVLIFRFDLRECNLNTTEAEAIARKYLQSRGIETGKLSVTNIDEMKLHASLPVFLAMMNKVDRRGYMHVEFNNGNSVTLSCETKKIYYYGRRQEVKDEMALFQAKQLSNSEYARCINSVSMPDDYHLLKTSAKGNHLKLIYERQAGEAPYYMTSKVSLDASNCDILGMGSVESAGKISNKAVLNKEEALKIDLKEAADHIENDGAYFSKIYLTQYGVFYPSEGAMGSHVYDSNDYVYAWLVVFNAKKQKYYTSLTHYTVALNAETGQVISVSDVETLEHRLSADDVIK